MGLEIDGQISDVWVFGYGSILWNPGFEFASCYVGYVEGYARRFWQGSVTHRGTSDSPGRVATLIQLSGNKAWGMAYHLVGTDMVRQCLEHLGVRECHLGGYEVRSVNFTQAGTQDSLEAWAFIAVPGNRLYLGPASLDDQALQVVHSRGVSGCNADYVTQLASFIRDHIPQDSDTELFLLDAKIKSLLKCKHNVTLNCDDLDLGMSTNSLPAAPPSPLTYVNSDCSKSTELVRKPVEDSVRHIVDFISNSISISVRAC